MKRRDFFKTSLPIVLPALVNGISLKALAETPLLRSVAREAGGSRVLVLIQLNGGNDGLNTVIPLEYYSAYHNARTNIAIPEDKVLRLEGFDGTGLHPAMPELQDFLGGLTRSSTMIAVRDDGTPWESEKDLQTRVSHFLRDLERDGLIGAGTTLHGLRVSYAAWWKRNGATDAEVADLLGDKSQRMGTHYTRHVTREDNVIRAFKRVKDAT